MNSFLNHIFSNAGKKLKAIIKYAFLVLIFACIIVPIVILLNMPYYARDYFLPIALAIMFVGPFVLFGLTLFTYGYAEIVDSAINKGSEKEKSSASAPPVKELPKL